MTVFSILIKNAAVELSIFKFLRKFKDGITFFEFKLNTDLYKDDHKPSLDFYLILINCMIFELNIYNIFHLNS